MIDKETLARLEREAHDELSYPTPGWVEITPEECLALVAVYRRVEAHNDKCLQRCRFLCTIQSKSDVPCFSCPRSRMISMEDPCPKT